MNYTVINNYITTKLGDIDVKIFLMKVKDLLPIYYVAVRGRDNIPGAVQRVLSKRRISSIKSFILDGNMFFNTFILNWVEKNYSDRCRWRCTSYSASIGWCTSY